MAIKRLNYFDHQFLVESDFTDEQKYHVDMRRRLNRLLYTHGIVAGLEVAKSASKEVTVRPGTAIDRDGREIIVEENQRIVLTDAAQFRAGDTVFIAIAYEERATDPSTATGISDNTRVTEQFTLQAVTTAPPPDGRVVPLAGFKLDGGANVPGIDNDTFDGGLRQTVQSKAGTKIADPVFSKVTLSNNFNQFPTLSSGAAKRVDLQGNLTVEGRLVTQTKNAVTAPGVAAAGAAFVWNSVPGFGLVARVTTSDTALPVSPTTSGAAIAGISDIATVNGVYATATKGTHALKVQGTAEISIPDTTQIALFVDGNIKSTGAKGGYVVDTFINASGQKLLVGDVVRLQGTPISRFEGKNSRIPVAEVTLADKENDSMVIGIVAQEAIPDPDSLDTRVEPNDPTFIEDGGELYLVTLGAFAHCKVDATGAAIEVGDLLTTSNNPGHAKKATNPKLGSIIGKALEPRKEGTGYIAVFVNIQ